MAQRVRDAHVRTFGPTRVLTIPPSLATDDFALFGGTGTHPDRSASVPTVYWSVGSVSATAWARAPGASIVEKLRSLPVNHSPEFAPDPVPTLRTATAALLAGARSVLVDEMLPPVTE